jgi:hypothetical protein
MQKVLLGDTVFERLIKEALFRRPGGHTKEALFMRPGDHIKEAPFSMPY